MGRRRGGRQLHVARKESDRRAPRLASSRRSVCGMCGPSCAHDAPRRLGHGIRRSERLLDRATAGTEPATVRASPDRIQAQRETFAQVLADMACAGLPPSPALQREGGKNRRELQAWRARAPRAASHAFAGHRCALEVLGAQAAAPLSHARPEKQRSDRGARALSLSRAGAARRRARARG